MFEFDIRSVTQSILKIELHSRTLIIAPQQNRQQVISNIFTFSIDEILCSK